MTDDSLKIGNGLPLVGPGTDVGISSLPMLGYLGKNYASAKVTTDGHCPACRAKGKLSALKPYRISFQESVFLCEDLQIVPLQVSLKNEKDWKPTVGIHLFQYILKRLEVTLSLIVNQL
uniref:Ubiquitin specific peptidase like 1 n=1 Tax=Mus musculus TaxID=10090 RepID=D6RI24_MOUSE